MSYLFLIPLVAAAVPITGLVWLKREQRKDKHAEQIAFAEMMRQNRESARRHALGH